MRLNSKVRYGLRTMVEIANNPKGILQKEISIKQAISAKYLDQIIAGLKAAGLITRGASRTSGYILLRSAEEITVYDIYKAFEFELNISSCVLRGKECPFYGKCHTKNYWCDLNTVIQDHMKQKKLSDITEDPLKEQLL